MKNILILGGAGFLGANLVRRCLSEPDISITVVDSLDPYFESTMDNLKDVEDKIDFIKGDIRDVDLMTKVVKDKDVIFNCAAQTSHPKSMEDPVLDAEINCIGALHVLNAAKENNPEVVIVYVSSSTLIGRAGNSVIDEDHGEKPLDIYSANKGVAEKYHRIYNRAHGLKTISLRLANLYGPFGKKSPAFGFINYFINLAIDKKPITIYGDGKQKRNPMYVKDAVDIMMIVANSNNLFGEAYFATHTDHMSVKEIAENIAEVFDGDIKYIPWPEDRKKIDVDDVNISSKKLYDLTDWKPKYSLKQGLSDTKNILMK